MDFEEVEPLIGRVAVWQFASFLLAITIAILCLLSLYVVAHQLYYVFRLMTAGPSGFDQAAIFYLTRTITYWRHVAVKSLFNGLLLFLILIAMQLLVKFYKDADKAKHKFQEVIVVNVVAGSTTVDKTVHMDYDHKLNVDVHVILGYVVL